MSTIKSIMGFGLVLAVSVSISACSSTLAPEDDSTTEYVFEVASGDQVVAKDDRKDRNWDQSDD